VCILAALVGAIVGGSSAAFYSDWRLRSALVMRPPIVGVDYSGISEALAEGIPATALQTAFQSYKAEATAARDAGFMVVNMAAIEQMPEGFVIPPPDLSSIKVSSSVPSSAADSAVGPAVTSAGPAVSDGATGDSGMSASQAETIFQQMTSGRR
jgi:hypothetical protein